MAGGEGEGSGSAPFAGRRGGHDLDPVALALRLEAALREGPGVPVGPGAAVHEQHLGNPPLDTRGRVVVEGDPLQREREAAAGRVEAQVEALARGEVALAAQALDLGAQAGGLGVVGLARGRRGRGRERPGGEHGDEERAEAAGAHQ